ncbi:hypothetical protein RhiirA1_479968 [Rhizophagus irregularis]|uniref:Uncharacterized protein n=1 Tax=Rhizophagus irregularis TaxID=588596 RepID=A0A2N0QPZ7_9GLOM|nr:hypothetical protein RhiirA1_479968 [Rhizophagus irregularis]
MKFLMKTEKGSETGCNLTIIRLAPAYYYENNDGREAKCNKVLWPTLLFIIIILLWAGAKRFVLQQNANKKIFII